MKQKLTELLQEYYTLLSRGIHSINNPKTIHDTSNQKITFEGKTILQETAEIFFPGQELIQTITDQHRKSQIIDSDGYVKFEDVELASMKKQLLQHWKTGRFQDKRFWDREIKPMAQATWTERIESVKQAILQATIIFIKSEFEKENVEAEEIPQTFDEALIKLSKFGILPYKSTGIYQPLVFEGTEYGSQKKSEEQPIEEETDEEDEDSEGDE